MATTPYFIWPTTRGSSSSASDDVAGFGFGAAQEDPAMMAVAAAGAALVSTEFSASTVGRPRMRRQSSSSTGTGRQPQQVAAGGGGAAPKKPQQRGLGVAELERLRCGGDPLGDLGVADVGMGDGPASVHGNSLLLHHHLPPAFDAATAGTRYYSPLLVQQHLTTPAPPAPGCYVHSHSAGGQSVAPVQPFMDRWGRMGGFAPAGSAAGLVHQNLLPAPEHPSSQSTVWRPASSSASCVHTGHRCELCSKTMMALTERASRVPAPAPAPAAAATNNMPDYSIYDLAAAMAAARKEAGEGLVLQAREGKKEVREIEFFPTSTNQHAGGSVGPKESEFATTRWTMHFSAAASSSSSGAGGCAAPLDLSLKL